MGRADFLFTFGDKNEIDGELAASATDGVKGREESGFRPLLVYGAAADDDFTEAGLLDECGIPRWRGPLGRVDLLDVVHEIEAERFGGAGVERGENAGLAVGGHLGDLREAGVAEHLHGQLAAFIHAAIFGGDGGLVNPGLQALERFVMTLGDFGEDGIEIGSSGPRAGPAT